jgi:uncharacterized Ntn-hydrolase superfamily protein
MTFSIVARMGDAYGVAVASRFIAVGSVVPAARLGAGAVATQAMARVSYATDALAMLATGTSAAEAVDRVTSLDEGRENRQLGVVSATDQHTFTGGECMSWAGGLHGGERDSGYAIQGNVLVGERVVLEMERAWLENARLPLAPRLMTSLVAGDHAGGDRRGRQSAALYAVAPHAGYDHCGVLADLRVDDHPGATDELGRLWDLHELYFGAPETVLPLEGDLADEVRRHLATLGRVHRDLHEALADWAGEANFEMRMTPDGIDSRVLQALRESASPQSASPQSASPQSASPETSSPETSSPESGLREST